MRTTSNEENKKLCLDLLRVDTEVEVMIYSREQVYGLLPSGDSMVTARTTSARLAINRVVRTRHWSKN